MHSFADAVVQIQKVHVAGVAAIPDGGDSDLGLIHIGFRETRGVQHSLGGTLRDRLGDMARDLVETRLIVGRGGFLLGESSGNGSTGGSSSQHKHNWETQSLYERAMGGGIHGSPVSQAPESRGHTAPSL